MSRSSRQAWMLVVLLVAGIVVLVFLPPFVPESVRGAVMDAFAPLCHQIADRSFTVGGVPLAVGHRCTGIYVGLLGGAAGLPQLIRWGRLFRAKSPWILSGLLLLLVIDWVGPIIGGWLNTPASRMGVGLLFGGGAGYYLGDGITQLFAPVFRRWAIRRNAGV